MLSERHEVTLRAYVADDGESWLQAQCGCGAFLMDKKGEATLPEITAAVTIHYVHVANPELSNGHKGKIKLIEGRG